MKKIEKLYKEGDIRYVKKFLWFPRYINNWESHKRETRWLESVTIKQRYLCCVYSSNHWVDVEFVDD